MSSKTEIFSYANEYPTKEALILEVVDKTVTYKMLEELAESFETTHIEITSEIRGNLSCYEAVTIITIHLNDTLELDEKEERD